MNIVVIFLGQQNFQASFSSMFWQCQVTWGRERVKSPLAAPHHHSWEGVKDLNIQPYVIKIAQSAKTEPLSIF